jgi:hypothetical protein
MSAPRLCVSVSLLLAGVGWGVLYAEGPATGAPKPAEKVRTSRWVFSLLPKALQKNPVLDFHVITEMTAAGQKLAPVTPQHPVYYLEHVGEFTQLGSNKSANEHPPAVADLERALQEALAVNGYLPAAPSTPGPRLFVVITFGSFPRFSTESYDFQQSLAVDDLNRDLAGQNPDLAGASPTLFDANGSDRSAASLLPIVLADRSARADVIERAQLIGGTKFAQELDAVLNEEAGYRQSGSGLLAPMLARASPFNRFVNADDNRMDLVEEAFSSCYFVTASAYDFAAMAKGTRVLLWRTKMTVDSIGVSMSDSLPPLIASAGPYLGRDMTETVTVTRRMLREGRVEVGTPTVLDDDSRPAPKAPVDGKGPPPAKP